MIVFSLRIPNPWHATHMDGLSSSHVPSLAPASQDKQQFAEAADELAKACEEEIGFSRAGVWNQSLIPKTFIMFTLRNAGFSFNTCGSCKQEGLHWG